MPVYNKAQSCAVSIQSCLDQSFTEFELIIVNDGSTDHSLDVIRRFDDHRVHIIDQPNTGVSSARNRGIKCARYEWIAFLDADDRWESTYLENVSAMIAEFKEASMFGTAYKIDFGDHYKFPDFKLPEGYRAYLDDYFKIALRHTLFFTSAVVINKSVFNTIEYFDPTLKMGEDLDLWFRIALNFRVAFNNNTLLSYNRVSENNSSIHKKDITFSLLSVIIRKNASVYKTNYDFRYFVNDFVLKDIFILKTEFINERSILLAVLKDVMPDNLFHFLIKCFLVVYFKINNKKAFRFFI